MSGSLKEKWNDLTDDEIGQINGKREHFEGLLQQKYGLTQEAAQKQVDDWSEKLKD